MPANNHNESYESIVGSVCIAICFCTVIIALSYCEIASKRAATKEEIRIEAQRIIDEELLKRKHAPSPPSPAERIDPESERDIPSV